MIILDRWGFVKKKIGIVFLIVELFLGTDVFAINPCLCTTTGSITTCYRAPEGYSTCTFPAAGIQQSCSLDVPAWASLCSTIVFPKVMTCFTRLDKNPNVLYNSCIHRTGYYECNRTANLTVSPLNCTPNDPCPFNGTMIPHTKTVTAYLSASVPNAGKCFTQVRTCKNGILDGSYPYDACAPDTLPVGAPVDVKTTGCYINLDPQPTCAASATNSDLPWTPDPAARAKLFLSSEVQRTADGCDSYAKLVKAECNPEFPVMTNYYDPKGIYKIRTLITERDIYLNSKTELSPGILSYLKNRIRIPSGDWSSIVFLQSIKVSDSMNIIDYVAMMNQLSQKYPTKDYRNAYVEFINGENAYLDYYIQQTEFLKAIGLINQKKSILTIINSVLIDE